MYRDIAAASFHQIGGDDGNELFPTLNIQSQPYWLPFYEVEFPSMTGYSPNTNQRGVGQGDCSVS